MAAIWDNPAMYRRTCKKKYIVHVYMPPLGTKVYNKFEKSSYVTSTEKPFVCVGTCGEEWVIDANKLRNTYTHPDSRPIMMPGHHGKGGAIRKDNAIPVIPIPGDPVWAVHVPAENKFTIPTSWGDVLQVNAEGVAHGTGDYLVCADIDGRPNLADRWVVNGKIFPTTYDMRPFNSK